jgi:hypothetical protein
MSPSETAKAPTNQRSSGFGRPYSLTEPGAEARQAQSQ